MPQEGIADEAKAIQAAVLADWEAGNVVKEFSEKQWERRVSDRDIERTLTSKSTLICRYTDYGQPRYGLWHPHVQVFIGWQPSEAGFRSELKTCIPYEDGQGYMKRQDDFEPVRWRER